MEYEEDYKMWLEEMFIKMNPDWICDGMTDKEFTHDWCEKYCGKDSDYLTPKCLHMYYHHIELKGTDGKERVMSKYDRDSRDVYVVKRLGDEIGYGHLMALAHELWARYLEEKGLPRKGAHCAVGYPMIKDEYQADALTDPIYKVIVERALADTPQTEREGE